MTAWPVVLAIVGIAGGSELPEYLGLEFPPPSRDLMEVRGGIALVDSLGCWCPPEAYERPTGTGVLRGKVVIQADSIEVPEPYVNVIAPSEQRGVVAAEDGSFGLGPLAAGWQVVVFKHLYFEPIRVCVDLVPGDTTEVTLVLKRVAPD